MSTLTYLKYCGNGFGEERALETGQKYGVLKDMEKNVSGYKALRNEIKELRFAGTEDCIVFIHSIRQNHHGTTTTFEGEIKV